MTSPFLKVSLSDWRVKHGHSPGNTCTREYKTWRSMRERCLNPRHPGYYRYGGRGITICERWSDFGNFLADMGPKPPRMSIDRINNDGNYEPSNCRWATPKQQSNNQHHRTPAAFCGRGHFCSDGAHKCKECKKISEAKCRKRRKAQGIVALSDLPPSQRAAFKLKRDAARARRVLETERESGIIHQDPQG